MAEITVGTTRVIVTRGMPETILPERQGRRSAVVLTQPGASKQASEVARSIKDSGVNVEVIGLPDRDEAKTLSVASTLYERFSRLGLGRDDTIVGVGGGSVTDLAGFVAGTWMRGIEVVHIPTTLLAAVDASLGGKTGVNLGGKNLVGVFWDPSTVLIDLDTLEELPAMLLLEGLAETLKAGFIGDVELVRKIEKQGIAVSLDEVVPAAIRVKAAYVGEDPRESSVRAMLNFGHTIGHAVEFASALSHGLSVGVGMVAAAAVSEKELGFGEADRVVSIIDELGLRPDVSGLDRTRVLDLLALDKKRDGTGLRMVLLEAIGQPTLRHIDMGSVDVALAAIGL